MAMTFPLQIFFDGACAVCSAEMEVYKQRNPDGRLQFIDISAADFQPAEFDKTHEEFMAQLHVRDGEGHFYTGIDAFMAIWQVFPSGSLYRFLSATVGLPGVNLLSRFGYHLFARNRHLLPKRKRDCESGVCNLNH